MTEEHSSEGGIVSKSSECFYFQLTLCRLDSHDTFYTYINQLLSVRLNKLNRLINVIVSSVRLNRLNMQINVILSSVIFYSVRFYSVRLKTITSLNKENTLSIQPSRERVNSFRSINTLKTSNRNS